MCTYLLLVSALVDRYTCRWRLTLEQSVADKAFFLHCLLWAWHRLALYNYAAPMRRVMLVATPIFTFRLAHDGRSQPISGEGIDRWLT